MNLNQLVMQWPGIIFISLCVISIIQIFYFLFFFCRLSFYKSAHQNISEMLPVSVIICARDEAANLSKNLMGTLIQQYPANHEIIVVDDNSFDNSKYFLESLQKDYKLLNVIELKQEAKLIRGKKFPLSIGIRTAKHEIVLLTDADCIPASEHWINNMQSKYEDNTEIILGYGAHHKKNGLLNKIIRWETFHTALQYFSYALAGIPYMGVGRNLSYKKAVFYRHNGFSAHNNIPSGDDDLFINMAATKTNTKINIDALSFTLSEPATTWTKWMNQKTRHYSTGKYYKPLHKILLGTYSLSHFVFFPLLILSLCFFNWKYALFVFFIRIIVQCIVFYPAMKKLNEKDLFPFFIFFDIWMFFYYLLFAAALIKKPRQTWN